MNFATLETDPASGLPFITDVATRDRLYKHPNCGLCGIARYSRYTVLPDCSDECEMHPARRVEEMFA